MREMRMKLLLMEHPCRQGCFGHPLRHLGRLKPLYHNGQCTGR